MELLKFTEINKGHMGILNSLLRGLDILNIPYNFNKIDKLIKRAVIIWTDEKDLNKIEKLYLKYNINFITTPECSLCYENTRYTFAQKPYISKVLVASDWVMERYKKKIDKKYHKKLKSWASGVEINYKDADICSIPKNSCICYYKLTPPNNELTKLIENHGIKCHIIEYGKYNFDEWLELIKNVDFVIFYQNNAETQGLAMAECWAQNKPTFIKYIVREDGATTSPYLTPSCGKFFNDIYELEKIIKEYKKSPIKFLKNFEPAAWVKENMSDKISVKKLIEIFEKIEEGVI